MPFNWFQNKLFKAVNTAHRFIETIAKADRIVMNTLLETSENITKALNESYTKLQSADALEDAVKTPHLLGNITDVSSLLLSKHRSKAPSMIDCISQFNYQLPQ